MSFFQQLFDKRKNSVLRLHLHRRPYPYRCGGFGIIMSKISSRKFRKSCKIISDFANESGVINDANLEQFEATCLDDKTNPAMLEGWETFKSARFGYPSEYIDKDKVLSRYCAKNFKKGVLITSLVLFAIAVVAGVYAIIVTRESNQFALLYAIVVMIFPSSLCRAIFLRSLIKRRNLSLTRRWTTLILPSNCRITLKEK